MPTAWENGADEFGEGTIDRRVALAGIAATGSGLAFEGFVAAVGTAQAPSPFGRWSTDAQGLPCYVFTADVPVKTVNPAGHSYPLEPDPVFLLGHSDLSLFAYASGRMLLVSGERGWVRLNEPTATTHGHAATLTVTGDGTARTHDLLGPAGLCASGNRATRTFGCGTARYRMTVEPGLAVERILSVAPSRADGRAQPAVVVTVHLTSTGPTPLLKEHVAGMPTEGMPPARDQRSDLLQAQGQVRRPGGR